MYVRKDRYHRTIPTTCANLNILWSCARGQRGDPRLGFFQTYLRLRVQWSRARGQTDRQTGRQTDEWRLPLFQTYLKVPWSSAGWQTDKQTDEPRLPFSSPHLRVQWNCAGQTSRQMNQDYPFSGGYLRVQWSCAGQTDKQTDEPRLLFFQWLPESSMKVYRTDRQTDKQTDEPRLPFFQWLPESSMKLCRRTDRQMIQDCPTSSPLTPDRMLMALVQNTASMPMYT